MLARNFNKAMQLGKSQVFARQAIRTMSSSSDPSDQPFVTDKADLHPSKLPAVPKQGSYKIMME